MQAFERVQWDRQSRAALQGGLRALGKGPAPEDGASRGAAATAAVPAVPRAGGVVAPAGALRLRLRSGDTQSAGLGV